MNFAFLPKLQVDRIFIETTTYDVPTWRYEKVRVFQEVYDIHKKPACTMPVKVSLYPFSVIAYVKKE